MAITTLPPSYSIVEGIAEQDVLPKRGLLLVTRHFSHLQEGYKALTRAYPSFWNLFSWRYVPLGLGSSFWNLFSWR